MMHFVWLFILLCLVSVNQFFLLHQNGKNKTFYASSVWVPGMQTCVSQTMQLMHGSPLNPHHHQLTPSPRPPPLFLSQAMMRGSCKQLISSLFAHMCLTPHGPQWVLGLCSDTISSANIGHWKKGGKKQNSSSGWSVRVSLTRVTVCRDGDAVCPPYQGPATRNWRYKLKYWRRESSVIV